MNRKSVLITGSTSGIGLAGAEALGRQGWNVMIHARSEDRGGPVLASLRARLPDARFDLVVADLSDLSQVASLADQVRAQTRTLDVLWNNAGMMTTSARTSVDGFEAQWAINHLAPFVLTQALLPLVQAAPQGRIVFTSSFAHHIGRVPRATGFRVPATAYNGWTTYGDTKLANILTAKELSRRLEATAVTVHAFHPGYVKTSFGANGETGKGNAASWLSFAQIPVTEGAATGVHLATSEEAGRLTGRYWANRKVRRGSTKITDANAQALWALTEEALAR